MLSKLIEEAYLIHEEKTATDAEDIKKKICST